MGEQDVGYTGWREAYESEKCRQQVDHRLSSKYPEL